MPGACAAPGAPSGPALSRAQPYVASRRSATGLGIPPTGHRWTEAVARGAAILRAEDLQKHYGTPQPSACRSSTVGGMPRRARARDGAGIVVMPHRSRTYLICLLGALAMGVVVPQASAAASSCNETAIYNQAYTGKITGHFSIACLQKARRDESAEMATYSNVDSVIAAAINKAQFVKTYRKANSDQVTPTQSADNGAAGVTSTGGTVAASGGHSSAPPAQSTAAASRSSIRRRTRVRSPGPWPRRARPRPTTSPRRSSSSEP